MKGQQISPWSIYNQKSIVDCQSPSAKGLAIKNNRQLPEISFMEAPNLDHNFISLSRRSKVKSELKNYSYCLTTEATNLTYEPFGSELGYEDSTIEFPHRIIGYELDKEQLKLVRLLDLRILIKYIREEIQMEYEEGVDRVPVHSNQAMLTPKAELSLPRLKIDRKMVICKEKHALSERESKQKEFSDEKMNKETISLYLKKEIKSMMGNRMRILGKSKELSFKN